MHELYEIPLHLGLAWVYARNQDFLIALLKQGCSPLDVALRQYSKTTSHKIQPCFGSPDEAWLGLRDAVTYERVDLRGTPYTTGHHSNALGTEEFLSVEVDVYPIKHCYRMDPKLAAQLVLDICPDQFRLRPGNWLTAGGWWWRHVEMDWDKLLQSFPELTHAAPTDVLNREEKVAGQSADQREPEIIAWQRLESSERALLQTYLECCVAQGNKGFIFKSAMNNAIRMHSGGTPQQPSDSTIRRAFKAFETASGIDLTENDEARLLLTRAVLG